MAARFLNLYDGKLNCWLVLYLYYFLGMLAMLPGMLVSVFILARCIAVRWHSVIITSLFLRARVGMAADCTITATSDSPRRR